MPALAPTPYHAEVTWIGVNPDRAAALESVAAPVLRLGFAGPEGESHAGLTRPSDSRVTAQHPRGTEIANVRQVSILSEEDLAAMAAALALPRLEPAWFGATLVVDMENRACALVAAVVERAHPGAGKRLKAVARHRRGVTAWVERPGAIALGARLRLHLPDQPPWPHPRR